MSATADQHGRISPVEDRSRSNTPYVIMLVPACNEERHIRATLQSLNQQTRRPDETIVIINNSHDNTEQIAQQMIPEFPGLKVLKMTENKSRKSGALNFALRTIPWSSNLIFGEMDADTQVAANVIEEGLKEFASDPNLGGLCSRCGVKPLRDCGDRPPGQKPTVWEHIVWLMQAFEYGLTDRRRADTAGHVKVLAGAFTMYTAVAFQRVCRLRHHDGKIAVFDESSRVEDYVLTLDVRSVGLRARAGQSMRSWTDVPTTIRGRQGLLAQRLRWYGGSVDELRRRKLDPTIRRDALMEGLLLFTSLSRLLAFGAMGFIIASPDYSFEWTPFSVIILVTMSLMSWALYLPSLSYIEHVPPLLRLLPLTIIPMQLYSIGDDAVLYYSYVDSFTNRRRNW